MASGRIWCGDGRGRTQPALRFPRWPPLHPRRCLQVSQEGGDKLELEELLYTQPGLANDRGQGLEGWELLRGEVHDLSVWDFIREREVNFHPPLGDRAGLGGDDHRLPPELVRLKKHGGDMFDLSPAGRRFGAYTGRRYRTGRTGGLARPWGCLCLYGRCRDDKEDPLGGP